MRLTTKNESGGYSFIGDFQSVINRLAEYEDLEEQGRLVRAVRCYEYEKADEIDLHDGVCYCNQFDTYKSTMGYCSMGSFKEEQTALESGDKNVKDNG